MVPLAPHGPGEACAGGDVLRDVLDVPGALAASWAIARRSPVIAPACLTGEASQFHAVG